MNKSELIDAIAESSGNAKADIGRCVDAFIAVTTKELQEGGQVNLTGFGSFSVGMRAARMGRNPQTGAPIHIKASRVVKYKAGKALKDAIQSDT